MRAEGPLFERFSRYWSAIGARESDDAYLQLVHSYSIPPRYHHNLSHITDLLNTFHGFRHLARRPLVVVGTIWTHDAKYELHLDYKAHKGENEQKSAEFGRELIIGHGGPQDHADAVSDIVLASAYDHDIADPDARLFHDLDFSILGRSPREHLSYFRKIWQEYAPVYGEEGFKAGRMAFLRRLQEKPVFLVPECREHFEDQAKRNIEKELEILMLPSAAR